MMKSCPYCGRVHPQGYECPKKPTYDRPRRSAADKFRKTFAWQQKRLRILDRDYHLCRVCNEGSYGTYAGCAYTSDRLSIHHIEPLEERFDLRLEEDNLLTCCSWHHKRADAGEIPREYLHGLAQTSPRWGIPRPDRLTQDQTALDSTDSFPATKL